MGSTMKDKPELTTRDHAKMDVFLGHILDDHKAGVLTQAQAVGALAHVMAALDLDNYSEARSWFEQGREFARSAAG